jgi:enterochelin esterase-like enzyme
MRAFALALISAVALASAAAQTAQTPAQGAGQMPGRGAAAARTVSPQVLPDRRITFRLSAPKASEVTLRFGEGAPQSHPMTKDPSGVWSVTIGPKEPEIYIYSFLVDGVKVIDLANPIMKVGASIDSSVVEVPGNPPRFDEVQNVPHGSIDIHTYSSAVSRTQRGLYVYVPPDYYGKPGQRFPVLYLWHGGGGAEQDWSRDGRAGVILDNLIAQKRAVPMLIVMPNNVPGTPAPGVSAPLQQTSGGTNYDLLKRELIEEIIPFVAKRYRTIENREKRAIAGLSAGGGTTLNVGLGSLDTFAWIAEFSSGIFGGTTGYGQFDIEKISPGFYRDPAATNKKLKLFYMSCGTEDPRLPFQKKALDDFQSHQIKVTFASFAGAHEWKVWRHSLADLAPKLFQ